MFVASIRCVSSVFVLALLMPGCGDPSASAQAAQHATTPQRVVCANTAASEFICLLVPAERVVGVPQQVDDYSAMDFKSHGFERATRIERYNAESVLALKPDLVVTHEWQSADTTNVLKSQGLDVLVMKSATSYDDIRATLVELGARLDAVARATEIVRDLDARVATLKASAPTRAHLTAMVYANSGTGGSTAGAHTTNDTTLHLAGLRNAAAEAGLDGHVNLDFERLLAIDPDFLIVASQARGEGGSATKAVVEATPALARSKARQPGHIVILPAALMSTDSPPLIDAAEFVAREVDRVIAGAKKD